MDKNDKDQWGKIICYGVVAIIAYYIVLWLLPYVVGLCAILGAGYLIHEYQKHNRRRW
jgi:hypothetical protein